MPAPSVVSWRLPGRPLPFAQGMKLFRGGVIVVSMTRLDQSFGRVNVHLLPFRLYVGSVGPSLVGALVPVEAKPFERLEYRLFRRRVVTTTVGVFNPDDELTTRLPGEYPVAKGRADVSDVGNAGRTGRVADTDRRDWACHSGKVSSG